ncbi:MAG: dockerin type I repeat-containing protein [candidate division Zixibacteria bacterium]|nr:dockerin type I repeat-containing protein [candidate division Zixibacteria bacterium]
MNKEIKPKLVLALCACFIVLIFSAIPAAAACGDIDGDGEFGLTDITYLINYLYRHGTAPINPYWADVNSSGTLNLQDLTGLIKFLYLNGPALHCPGVVHDDMRGDCQIGRPSSNNSDSMVVEVIGNDLHIRHLNAFYNCCLRYMVDYYFERGNITAVESDTGMPCDCLCPFDLESVLYGVPAGTYIVRLIGIYGDTVGIDTVMVSGGDGLSGYDISQCHADLALTFQTDSIAYTFSAGMLTMNHYDAEFNCAATIVIQFGRAGDTLRFYEINTSSQAAYCLCSYDITASASGIAPGAYVAEIYQLQYPWEQLQLFDRRTVYLE